MSLHEHLLESPGLTTGAFFYSLCISRHPPVHARGSARPNWGGGRSLLGYRLHGGASGSGGPSGKRNGQYRHGERTKAAIAEERKFSALLKMLRWPDLMTNVSQSCRGSYR